MKSNKCLFNKAIFKSGIKRFLPFAIPLLIINLIIFPIIIYSNFNLPDNPLDMESFAGMSIASDVFNFGFSGLFALLVFSYLYKANMCNAIHAFPIGRRGLFVSNFVAGYALLVVPQLIGFAVSIPGIWFTSKVTSKILLMQFTSIFAESFIFYSIGALAVMLAGNIFAGAVIYIIINFAVPAVRTIFNLVVSSISYGMLGFGEGLFSSALTFSPVTELIAYKMMFTYGEIEELEGVSISAMDSYYPKAALYLAVAIVAIALAYLFYKLRKLECAGDMVAFRIEVPVISVIVTFVGGALLSMFVSIFVPFKITGFVILYVAFSFVVFIITQMILNKTPKIFNLKNMLLWAISCVVIIAGFYFVSVYRTNYIPTVSKVNVMNVNSSYDITIKDEETIRLAEQFHKALIENEKHKPRSQDGFFDRVFDGSYSDDGLPDYDITIGYVLKNGRKVSRHYSFTTKETELVKMLDRLESLKHPDSVFTKLENLNYKLERCSYEVIFDDYTSEGNAVPKEMYQELFNACKESTNSLMAYYTTSKDISNEQYNQALTEYRIDFKCKISEDESKKKLEKDIAGYFYDPLGNHIEIEYEESFDGFGRYNEKISDEFNVVVYVKSDSAAYEMIKSLQNSETA